MIPLPNGGGFISDEEIAALAAMRTPVDRSWRSSGAVTPAVQARLLADAERHHAGQVVRMLLEPSPAPSPDLPTVAGAPSPATGCDQSVATVQDAAVRLGITPRAVRGLIERYTLDAVQDSSGRWHIDRASLDANILMRRATRATPGTDRPTDAVPAAVAPDAGGDGGAEEHATEDAPEHAAARGIADRA